MIKKVSSGEFTFDRCPVVNCTFKGVTKGLNQFSLKTIMAIANGQVFYENDVVPFCEGPCRWFLEESG